MPAEPDQNTGAGPSVSTGPFGRLFRRQPKPSMVGSGYVLRDSRSDLTVAALGITLGLICALFPWYIFFNPDQFGVRAVKFSGQGQQAGPITLYPQPDRIGAPMESADLPPNRLDLFATGTATANFDRKGRLPGVDEQPYPVDIPPFRLVHVANGRAMIADDTGLWLVQRGSTLPDNSKVAAIEQREGAWVLVTSDDRVIPLTR